MNRISAIVLAVTAAVLLVNCGQKEPDRPIGVAAYLPGGIENPDVGLTGAIEVFRGDSLYYHINGGAEIYHTYGFEEVASAYYLVDGNEISVDLHQFEDPAGAFGLYSTLRPRRPNTFDVGVEGFATSHTREFVKGRHVARLTAYETDNVINTALDSLATAIAESLPGPTTLPPTFAHFPDTARQPRSEKIYSVAYLGLGFMSDVYTVDYVVGDDSLTLFLTRDTTGEKMLGWQGNMPGEPKEVAGLDRLEWDGLPMAIEHSYYGTIVAGSRSGWMAGGVGYSPSRSAILSKLLESLME